MAEAVTRVHDCFRNINKKYYREGNDILFSHLHSDHWAMFLYLVSNTVYRAGDENVAAKLFILNKALHGVDAFYGIGLPETFLFVHPVGTVLGNAKYGNYFVTYQNCAIGATESGYPTFGDGVVFYAKSSCLGGCQIGDEVVFGANSFLIDKDVPSNSVVIGQFPGQKIKPNEMTARERVFGWL
ncbi:serine acetyltransferase [Fimbriimonas ginsengisoli Gsoil 348]|uniref:Serine acetyltransferase n=1 Tax=Fimbriimonas ginsengisoli Gsoil 348 TaxID=661478 RepID=A0A068NTG6_FIMGI|nr:serine acetyltransferase [Fimbriimonas ginsengisoli Gsoil 348]